LESKKYRHYAAECVRLAQIMAAGDKQALLEIADAGNGARRRPNVGRKSSGADSAAYRARFIRMSGF
jgi:hypothetical protein